MGSELIDSKYLIDSDWVGYALQTIEYYGYKYYFYIHLDGTPTLIGGGPFGSQTIYPLDFSTDEAFIVPIGDLIVLSILIFNVRGNKLLLQLVIF